MSLFKSSILIICILAFSTNSHAQLGSTSELKRMMMPQPDPERDFRVELEPASLALGGAAASISYNVTRYNDFNMGIYLASLRVPKWAQTGMFNNVGDTTEIRLGFEAAFMARFKINVFKNWESNPYIGVICGWEYFDIVQPNDPKFRISTGVFTPYVGYEFYVYKKMLYLNPQIRSVYYFATESSDPTRPETLGKYYILPQVSIGFRF